MISRTVEIGGMGCEVEIEAVVVAIVSGEGFGTSLPGRDLGGGGGSFPKNRFFGSCGCVYMWGKEGREGKREREGERGKVG